MLLTCLARSFTQNKPFQESTKLKLLIAAMSGIASVPNHTAVRLALQLPNNIRRQLPYKAGKYHLTA